MLLLYQADFRSFLLRIPYLHSIMLLLYLDASLSSMTAPASFTFHYASTLSNSRLLIVDSDLYLHSIMLLLYQMFGNSRKTLLLIYIPLCFYFIDSVYGHEIIIVVFTFHYASTLSLFPAGRTRLFLLFTFHYASTLSPCVYLCVFVDVLFTFHYASTLSGIQVSLKPIISYLHSIMLLLYHKADVVSYYVLTFTFHYASTLSQ